MAAGAPCPAPSAEVSPLSPDLVAWLELDELPVVVASRAGAIVFANRAARAEWGAAAGAGLLDVIGLERAAWVELRRHLGSAKGLLTVPVERGRGAGAVLEAGYVRGQGGRDLLVLRTRERRAARSTFDGATGELVAASDPTERLRAEVARLKERNRTLTAALGRDELTGVASRRTLFRALANELRGLRRAERGLGLLMVDVDHFKRFNDALGHGEGDRCLADVAAALRGGARRARDVVARYGGEEFAVILPGVDARALGRIADLVRRAVADRRIEHPDSPVAPWVTVSVGAAWFAPGAAVAPRVALDRADRALYAAKVAGRDRVEVALPAVERRA